MILAITFEENENLIDADFGEITTLTETPEGLPGAYKIDNDTLVLQDGILSVNTTDKMEQDNTRPITSAGVYATVGNIEALLKTI